MLIKTLPVGHLQTNCYIVTDENTKKCAIIDPGAETNTILNYIEENSLTPEVIFLTHGHFDHYGALYPLMNELKIPGYIHKSDVTRSGGPHMLEDEGGLSHYAEGDIFKVGGLVFNIIETPGHSSGSVTIICEDALFTGDTLFRDSCGRTDLGGSMEVLLKSLKRLADLDGEFEVYPGHAEATMLSRERSHNYYVRYATGEIQPE